MSPLRLTTVKGRDTLIGVLALAASSVDVLGYLHQGVPVSFDVPTLPVRLWLLS